MAEIVPFPAPRATPWVTTYRAALDQIEDLAELLQSPSVDGHAELLNLLSRALVAQRGRQAVLDLLDTAFLMVSAMPGPPDLGEPA